MKKRETWLVMGQVSLFFCWEGYGWSYLTEEIYKNENECSYLKVPF